MRQQMNIRWMLAVAVAVLAAALAPMAAANPNTAMYTAGQNAEQFIPGVTDSTTGVLRELERRRREREPFIPGVTDSGTGVLRELERNKVAAAADADQVGFEWDDSATGATATVAAAIAAASLVLVLRGRRRRLAI